MSKSNYIDSNYINSNNPQIELIKSNFIKCIFVAIGQVDDVVDASIVHGLCGLWGMIATGLFTTKVGYGRAYNEVRVTFALHLAPNVKQSTGFDRVGEDRAGGKRSRHDHVFPASFEAHHGMHAMNHLINQNVTHVLSVRRYDMQRDVDCTNPIGTSHN